MEILAKLFSFSAGVFALDVSGHIHLWWRAVIICIKSAVAEACRNTDMHLGASARLSAAQYGTADWPGPRSGLAAPARPIKPWFCTFTRFTGISVAKHTLVISTSTSLISLRCGAKPPLPSLSSLPLAPTPRNAASPLLWLSQWSKRGMYQSLKRAEKTTPGRALFSTQKGGEHSFNPCCSHAFPIDMTNTYSKSTENYYFKIKSTKRNEMK